VLGAGIEGSHLGFLDGVSHGRITLS
jgi:hypothetical protein